MLIMFLRIDGMDPTRSDPQGAGGGPVLVEAEGGAAREIPYMIICTHIRGLLGVIRL